MVASPNLPHNDFKEVFIAGYQAVRGTQVAIPAIPAQPATRANQTPFLMGIRRGIERATGVDIAEL